MLHSISTIVREAVSRKKRESTFRENGEITGEEFLEAGDYLTTRFPQWKWFDADTPGTRSKHLEGEERQFIAIRGVACHHRLDDTFAGDAVQNETMVGDGEGFRRDAGYSGSPGDDEDGWLRTGKLAASQEARTRDVRTVDESGNIGDREPDEEDKFPNMDDMMTDEEDDTEAIIRDPIVDTTGLFRKYNVYIAYAPGYNTPRIYLSGYYADNTPLPPHLMMEDIVGDYRDKTVTLEKFPHFKDNVWMASVHPCMHAPVMKTLLDRADNALKIRREKQRMGLGGTGSAGLEGLVDNMTELGIRDQAKEDQKKHTEDEWEVVQDESNAEKKEVAIRVDQYLVVFLKFISSVTPTIEYDSTMGI